MNKARQTGFRTVDTYRFIVDWALAHKGNTPSLREIGNGCDFSNATAHHHVQVLIGLGLLQSIDGQLCVTRLVVIAPQNIYDMERPERIHPDMEEMAYIPKEMTFSRTHPKEMGIMIGEAVDDEFMAATYPHFWKFVTLAEDSLSTTYQLIDDGGVTRAVMVFDMVNYRANIHFWG